MRKFPDLLCFPLLFILMMAGTAAFAQESLRREFWFYPIEIGQIYGPDLQPIQIYKDSSFQFRTFIMNDAGHVKKETYLFQDGLNQVKKFPLPDYLHPGFSIQFDYFDFYPLQRDSSLHRLFFIYKKDTLMLDFFAMKGALKMDSLVIRKGYYKIPLHPDDQLVRNSPDQVFNANLLKRGFTPTTWKQLQKQPFVFYASKVDTSFLEEKNLPASFYLRRASHQLHYLHPEQALKDIRTVIGKRRGEMDCEIWYLLMMAHSQAQQYDRAIEALTASIHCPMNLEKDPELPYIQRSSLYELDGQLDMAAADLDTVVMLQPLYPHYHAQRAKFRLKYRMDFQKVIDTLTTYTREIPSDPNCAGLPGTSNYCEVVFLLGLAEYSAHQERPAFRHIAAAVNMGYVYPDTLIRFMDSLLILNPQSPELKFADAVAHAFSWRSQGYGTEEKHQPIALRLLTELEQRGIRDYRISKGKAYSLFRMERRQEALVEINQAIALNDMDPGCYYLRAMIRGVYDGPVYEIPDPEIEKDPDVMKMRELCPLWKYDINQ